MGNANFSFNRGTNCCVCCVVFSEELLGGRLSSRSNQPTLDPFVLMIDIDKDEDFEPLDRCRVLGFQFPKFAEKVKEILLLSVKAKDVCFFWGKVNGRFQLEFGSRAAWIFLKITIAHEK